MTVALNHIWNYFHVFARSSFRFLLTSSLLTARSPLLLSFLPCLPAPCPAVTPRRLHGLGSLCRAFPYSQRAALDSVLLEISGKRMHVPACKQSVRLPFLLKHGRNNSVLTLRTMF